jgi:hypothetical protein
MRGHRASSAERITKKTSASGISLRTMLKSRTVYRSVSRKIEFFFLDSAKGEEELVKALEPSKRG